MCGSVEYTARPSPVARGWGPGWCTAVRFGGLGGVRGKRFSCTQSTGSYELPQQNEGKNHVM